MSQAYATTPDDDATDQEPAGFDLMAAINSPNLADELDDATLNAMGAKVVEEFALDETSRKEAGWDERNTAAMKLALLTKEAKSFPWPNASNVKFPLVIKAAIEFNSRAYPALVDGPQIVKGATKGRKTPEKDARADRIGKHMSYQLLDQMDDWEEDTDSLLIQLPIVGTAIRKSYFDPVKGYNCSTLVSAQDFVVNYMTKDLATCPRATHVLTFYPHEVAEKMRGRLWLERDLGRPVNDNNDDQAPHTFLEQHRLWDLDGDDYPEPYIVTVHKESQQVVRVVARFDETGITQGQDGSIVRIKPFQTFTKYGFIPSPDAAWYDIGFGHLLGHLGETINTALNQIMDAATLANMGGGWIGEGVSIKSGTQTRRPGEWKKAAVNGGTLRDNIVPNPTQEPSAVLYNLMVFLIEVGKDVTATQDILNGDAGKGTMPVGTVSALIEQGLKTFTAIVKRLHRALKKELAILYRLNGRYLEPEEYFTFLDEENVVAQQDYAEGDMDVVPVSDPNMATDMQRMQQAQFVSQYMGAPGMNPQAIIKRALEAARVPNPEELFAQGPPPEDPKVKIEQGKVLLQERKEDREDALAAVEIEATEVATEIDKANLLMMGPDVAAQIEAMVQAGIDRILERITNGGSPQVHQGDVHGMDQQPPHPDVPGPPEGGPGPDGGPMGAGGPDGPGQPGADAPPGGVLDPQLA